MCFKNTSRTKIRKKIHGFSLLELMLSLALSVILILAATEVYFSIKRTNAIGNTLAAIQETGRYLAATLAPELRMAGNDACEHKKNLIDVAHAIHGYTSNHLPLWLQNQVQPGTDAVVISECVHYQNTEQFLDMAYFVANTGRVDAQGEPVYALYRKPETGPRQELVSDVNDMQLRYGVLSKNGKDVLKEKPADAISDWSKVRSVSIAFLLVSENAVLQTPQSYVFNGETHNDHGKWLHKEWDLYVYLRDLATLDQQALS